jgi:glutamate racemase
VASNTTRVFPCSIVQDRFPRLVFVQMVPADKPAVLGTKTGRVGLLGTERTIRDPYNAETAASYRAGCRLISVAAPELMEFRYILAGYDERGPAASPILKRSRPPGRTAWSFGSLTRG